jgi:hypothetical protein
MAFVLLEVGKVISYLGDSAIGSIVGSKALLEEQGAP